jgi:hypothetical protein
LYIAGCQAAGNGRTGTSIRAVAYCRDIGPMEIVLRAVDTSGNRSGPSNAIVHDCN